MNQIFIFFLYWTLIKLVYSENNECVETRKWQIGYTMYENSWFDGKLYVYARCNNSSYSLHGRNWNICEGGRLAKGLPRCYPKSEEEFFNCEVGSEWQDGITKYEVIRYGEGLYVSAKCVKEDFIIDRATSVIPCDKRISNHQLPQCRKGEVKNLFEACATGRRSRSDDYEFENEWHHGALYVRVFCNHEQTETRSDTILCENGKMKRSPTINFCEIQRNDDNVCVYGKKWTVNDTEYEIKSIGSSLMVIGKCIAPGFQIDYASRKLCDNGRIPSVLPQCKVIDLPSSTVSHEVHTTNRNSSHIAEKSIDSSDRNECMSENGGCNQICENENGTVQCSCKGGYELQEDGKTCVGKINENTCVLGKKWIANNTEYEIFGRENDFKVVSKCKKGKVIPINGWKPCEEGKIPLELPQCRVVKLSPRAFIPVRKVHVSHRNISNPASKSTRLSENKCTFENGGCDQICKTKNGTIQCSCSKGYELHKDNKACVDVNECLSNNFGCSDECINARGSAYCSCRDGFTLQKDGKHCTDIDECENRATNKCNHWCHNTKGSYECSCRPGYVLINDFKCEDTNECLSENFGCSDKCINTRGSAYCSCPDGFTLQRDGKLCMDIDECANNATNKCDHRCHNTDGSYKCSCWPGYVLINDFKCEGCRKNSYRSSLDTFCVDCPVNSHTEYDSKSSIADCICNSGFFGNISNDEPCRDIDECESSNFGCSDSCINTIGSAFCSCPLGFQLQNDQKTCSDIDECHVKNGGCQGICHNSNGSFRCTCEEGYTVSTTDSYACDDINECLENNGGCSGECVNFLGSYQCSCPDDSFLAEDEKTCLTLYCPEVPIPHHSRLKCFPKANKAAKSQYFSHNSTYSEKLPVGSVCNVTCNTGYAINESSSVIRCQKNGMWNNTLEECNVSQCPSLEPPEYGDVHPPECKGGLMTVKEKCYFTCNEGYSIKGNTTFTCKNNLQWKYDKIPICEPIYIPPYITCPSDVELDLLPDKNSSVVFLKYPKSNVEDVQVTPDWVDFGRNVSFPAGTTDIFLAASSPHFKNLTANCTFSVIVLDSQSPEFLDCPETISAIGSNVGGAVVKWEEPTAFDNVGIKFVSGNAEPNSTWFPGLHIVEYIAEDFAGNIARCSFEINVTSGECEDLMDPENGYANCQDWVYGKVCEPTCYDNYTRRYNEDELYYFCDDNGVWTPSDVISPCFPECESEKIWSPELESCVDITENTTDTLSV